MKKKNHQNKEEVESSEFEQKLEGDKGVFKEQSTPAGTGLSISFEEVFDPGELFDAGYIGKSVKEIVQIANEIAPFKPVRVVKYWTWFDLRCDQKAIERYAAEGLKPVMLMADQIIYDSTQPESVGNWVRTSLLLKFHSPGAFETRNRIYMMIDAGRRKPVSPAFIASLH
ncbi:hypothetical protein [uncultured Neptuniibacter sp.]|uniref:DUF6957 family protein n=1 Tax=uncultured Neptuniibacter sp. TaxID=502143 RepID=UPI0026248F31|nr:hypothetical protein [uncultured Neptuniibacter sp.]